jgi:hypothetical protein
MSPAPRGVRTKTDAGHLDHGFAGRTPHGPVAYCMEEALPHVQAVPSAGSLDAHERGTPTAGYRNREDQSVGAPVILQPVSGLMCAHSPSAQSSG